uniref:Nudix hydrolase domain-containing protein n=1 Tax=Chenopodium quinoa TaxID=63459 RepID=A0A803MS07_CHEQI
MDEPAQPQEYLDVLTKTGHNTRVRKPRGDVHKDGDYHRAVHVWIYSESTNELLLQKRADCKDSWPGQWDISSAGHISAGDSSLITARRELQEELGVNLPEDAFELLFVFLQECIINDGNYINNEYNDVYLVTTIAPIPLEAFSLQLDGISDSDKEALVLVLKAAMIMDDIFHQQVCASNPALRDWLKEHADTSPLNKLNWKYFAINKSPWSCLDENQAFLSTADSAIVMHSHATKPVSGWKGLEYKAAFPLAKPPGANFYPSDMDKLKKLHSKADAFLSNDYYDSDIAWMELDSKLDVTIGPYETYEDALFGYKATFEAFIGVRDDDATAKLKLFGDNLLVLEQNPPMKDTFKSKDVTAAPIRVIQPLYNAGDVKGPQTVAFNLPNDERIVKDRGTSMVMLKNVSEAKFKHILFPIAEGCISKEQQELVDFDSFFTHTICHECCHGIGPHSIVLPDGQKSTELQELHSALEEAKADYSRPLGTKFFHQSVYVGLVFSKGQALQFNWLFEKEAFILHPDGRFSVDFDKILTIQATGDKIAASSLLEKYCKITNPLRLALDKLESSEIAATLEVSSCFTIVVKCCCYIFPPISDHTEIVLFYELEIMEWRTESCFLTRIEYDCLDIGFGLVDLPAYLS